MRRTLTCLLLVFIGVLPVLAGPQQAAPTDSLTAPAAGVDSLAAAVSALAEAIAAFTAQQAAQAAAVPTQVSLEEAGRTVQHVGLRLFWVFVVFILTALLIKGIVYILDRLSERSSRQRLFYKRLVPIVRILIWTVAFFIILRGIFQLDAAGLAAAAAGIGVAVGFAAQDVLKNIFGGILIIFDQPFQVGDKIAVGGTYGEVVSIGLRSTRIVTPDDNLVSVPNAQVVDGQVANANAGALNLQVVTDLYLPGWVDEAQAKQIAYDAAAASRYVYLDKPIVVLVKDVFKETFLTQLKVKAYVLDPRYEFLLMSEVTERARAEFRKQGLLTALPDDRAYAGLAAPPPEPPDA